MHCIQKSHVRQIMILEAGSHSSVLFRHFTFISLNRQVYSYWQIWKDIYDICNHVNAMAKHHVVGSGVIWTVHSKHWSLTTSSQWQAKPFDLRGHSTRWRRGPGRGDNALGNWVCMHHVASYKLCKPHRSDFWRMAQSTSGTCVFCGECKCIWTR